MSETNTETTAAGTAAEFHCRECGACVNHHCAGIEERQRRAAGEPAWLCGSCRFGAYQVQLIMAARIVDELPEQLARLWGLSASAKERAVITDLIRDARAVAERFALLL